jgi:hypothetical protein
MPALRSWNALKGIIVIDILSAIREPHSRHSAVIKQIV